MTIIVWETKASSYTGGRIREFESWEELVIYMKSKYSLWIIEFNVLDWVRRSSAKKLDARIIMYDDYLERRW